MTESPLVIEALELARQRGPQAAILFLSDQEAPQAAADAWSQVVIDLYWKHKNLPAVTDVAREGIDFALKAAAQAGEPAAARQLKVAAMAMAYNLASYTWSGWDEPGIEITDEQQSTGRWAAELNLRLVGELGLSERALSRGNWIIGAVQLADGHVRAAAASFGRAAALAERAGIEAEQRLNEAYRALAERLERPDDPDRRATYDAAREALAAVADGPELVGQIDTAWEVFSIGVPTEAEPG